MEPAVARNMVKGLPDTLHSEFRLSYSMLLNLLRGEGRLKARELLAASFKQFQVEQALPALKHKVEALEVITHYVHIFVLPGPCITHSPTSSSYTTAQVIRVFPRFCPCTGLLKSKLIIS